MKRYLFRLDHGLRADRRLREAKDWIDAQQGAKAKFWSDIREVTAMKQEGAALHIQSCYRGYRGRLRASERRAQNAAATCVQRHLRGKLGRRIAEEKKWDKVRVTPTSYALKITLSRSHVTQTSKTGWREYYDPDTRGFFYYEPETRNSTWDPPTCFADSMICLWDPWPYPYSSPHDRPCRARFTTMHAYQSHRLSAHSWHCPACSSENTAMTFPVCEMCGNSRDENGEDLEKVLKAKLKQMLFEAHNPNQPDFTSAWEGAEHSMEVAVFASEPAPERMVQLPNSRSEAEDEFGAHEFSDAMSKGMQCPPQHSKDKEIKEQLSSDPISSTEQLSNFSRPALAFGARLRVCHCFLNGQCSLTTCPMAHPGVRDDAKISESEVPGLRSIMEVEICSEALRAMWGEGEECPHGGLCHKYHPYVRPATADIIKKIYPKKNGPRVRMYPSGAKMDGTVKNEVFEGWGVYTWPSGGTYVGEWVAGMRHGRGTFSSKGGREYVGLWRGNVRHGWGVLSHPNGEVYEGQFSEGLIHGVGRLESANGDVYEGQFERSVPNGMGQMCKKNGDKYMGHIVKGCAQGLGVLAYSNGEKYRGYFFNDMRSGNGVCAYANGSKFAGSWFRNLHHGFGVFVTADGERYAGQWMRGVKHGYGRYYFKNQDIYGGDFRHNKACGQGVYRHSATGNYYAGSWSGDKKNGKGAYHWNTGSSYDGWWRDNSIEGKGVLRYANGEIYQGLFLANKKNGMGSYTWANGNCYKGSFVNNWIAGTGEMTYKQAGHRYSGSWKNNAKHGFGTFWYADGNVYEGNWEMDSINGKGKLTFFKGIPALEESYDGAWVNGIKDGHGTYRYKSTSGMLYEGFWHKGLRHGFGMELHKDGSFYKVEMIELAKAWNYEHSRNSLWCHDK
ncbi:unnamed protein product [Chrysoparadoxa australica]